MGYKIKRAASPHNTHEGIRHQDIYLFLEVFRRRGVFPSTSFQEEEGSVLARGCISHAATVTILSTLAYSMVVYVATTREVRVGRNTPRLISQSPGASVSCGSLPLSSCTRRKADRSTRGHQRSIHVKFVTPISCYKVFSPTRLRQITTSYFSLLGGKLP